MKLFHLVSENEKTKYSINFPISVCRPTPICRKICYARRGRLVFKNSIERQNKVLKIFQEEDIEKIAYEIGEGYKRRALKFLRWCGSGDLVPKACSVINLIGKNYSKQIHWVVTRKVDNIKLLNSDLSNIYIMYSLDDSDESKRRQEEVEKINNRRVYYSFLRESANQDIRGAKIIFDSQKMKGKLPYNKRCCPVDSGKIPLTNACEKCKKCFSPGVYK
jgi:hypothetical protein